MTTWRVTNCVRYTECPDGRGVDGADTYAGESDVIYRVDWLCQAQVNHDGTFTGAQREGHTTIEPFGGGDLIPYADVTEADILAWVHVALGESAVDAIQADVEARLAANQQPPTEDVGLPWR
jgi:hypothetical protein